MICPFRIEVQFDHEVINSSVILKAQREVYPPCYEGECPIWVDRYGNWSEGYCSRLEGDDDE